MGEWKTLAIAFSLLVLVTAAAPASILMFTHDGNGSGTLAGNLLPASDFVITAVGDTDDRLSFENGWWINHISASIWIDGLGDLDFLSPTRHFVNNNNSIVGFSRAKDLGGSGPDLFDGPTDAVFGTWDMLGPIGPISGSGALMQWGLSPEINTTGGILFFDSDSGVSTTFTAIPEPATICLLGLGGLAALRRRKSA